MFTRPTKFSRSVHPIYFVSRVLISGRGQPMEIPTVVAGMNKNSEGASFALAYLKYLPSRYRRGKGDWISQAELSCRSFFCVGSRW